MIEVTDNGSGARIIVSRGDDFHPLKFTYRTPPECREGETVRLNERQIKRMMNLIDEKILREFYDAWLDSED